MAKTNNLHIRIDPKIQQKADKVLKRLGMTIPDAVTIFLNQIGLEGGIPFKVRLPRSIDMFEDHRDNYCYGIEMPETYYGCKDLYDSLTSRATPQFKAKLESWLDQTIKNTKEKAGDEWDEDIFWARVIMDSEDKEYGASASFDKLFKDAGLHLIYCLPIPNEHNEVGPELWPIIGFYMKGLDVKRAERNEKPKIHRILIERLRKIFSHVDDSELSFFDVFYSEDWELPYNPNDPNFMTKDDY